MSRPGSAALQRSSPVVSTSQGTLVDAAKAVPVIAIVGSPNVGKSVMFNALTGRYVTVSNYPGTTVEVSRGRARFGGHMFGVVDTPGMYSLTPITDEERVARRVLLDPSVSAVIHVIDAKNLDRMLPLTVQLVELGLPVVLVLNMMDEAERLGLQFDVDGLSSDLGIPVVAAVAVERRGLDEIEKAVLAVVTKGEVDRMPARYEPTLEGAADEIARQLPGRFARSARGIALLLMQDEGEIVESVREADPAASRRVEEILARDGTPSGQTLRFRMALQRQEFARRIAQRHIVNHRGTARSLADRLSEITITPVTGLPILAVIVYFGLYKFVGVFGAGEVVDFLEKRLFGAHINPWFNGLLGRLLPGSGGWQYWARELFGGEYGLVTLGVTYAMAIVLPIVSLFFLFFSVLEDTGYFPRLALLVDRAFKRIGLNGRAVIPIVLGFGCDTMATMVTRIQETKRERVITTLLLALAIPCAAQYGLITALLAKQPAGVLGLSYAWLVWAGILAVIFVFTGRLASRFVPGEPASFYMELPPLRLPRLGNVVVKTLARMEWYFLEVLPFFLLASLLIWIGRITGAFDALVAALRPVVALIGLPREAATAFLYGFFRRDFGAAGLYQMSDRGQLSGAQLLVACVTLTLFLPCVAQFLVMKKERGLKTALAMSGGIIVAAFVVGGVVNLVLKAAGVTL
jgi:ferrous iron transport protein B